MIVDLCPRIAKLNCRGCHYISGALIQPCFSCENTLFRGGEESDSDEPAIIKVPKRYKNLTPQEIRIKQQNKKIQEEQTVANILRRQEEAQAKRTAFIKNLLNSGIAFFLNQQRLVDDVEYQIINQIIQTNIERNLTEFNRIYPENLEGAFTRGPANIGAIHNYVNYNKPLGFIGIALNVPRGNWLKSDGNENEWMVAYHGTGLEATQSIIREGLRAGPGQSFRGNLNRNPLSAQGQIGIGIFCTPDLPEAIAHNRARNVVCILQCRVNPRALKISDGTHWVVNDTQNIRPYRLLIRRR